MERAECLLADGTCNYRVFQISHQCIQTIVKTRTKDHILQRLKAVPVARNIRRMQRDVSALEHLMLEIVDLFPTKVRWSIRRP